DWDLVLDVNLRGAFLLTQATVALFPESGGAIVNISSIHASHAFPDSIPYACSKAGLVALTRNLALELSSRHIRVNCICPGYNSPASGGHLKKHYTVLSGALKREFQKDLELFKHFLLLLNNTSPIRNVELMWHEEGEELDPLKEKFKSRVGTGDALVQLQPMG